jgi:hypothetical protein
MQDSKITEDHKREITELWIVAQNYLRLAKEEKDKFDVGLLKKKTTELENKDRFDENFIMSSAHLASCAIRLCTIDDKLKDIEIPENSSSLYEKRNNFCDDTPESMKKKMKTLHFIMRNNVAHLEEHNKRKSEKNRNYLHLQAFLYKLPRQALFDQMEIIRNAIYESLKKNALLLRPYAS